MAEEGSWDGSQGRKPGTEASILLDVDDDYDHYNDRSGWTTDDYDGTAGEHRYPPANWEEQLALGHVDKQRLATLSSASWWASAVRSSWERM